MELGLRVKQKRLESGLSIRALAEKIGVSHSAINAMENRNVSSSKYVAELAEALGVSVEWLLTGEGRADMPTANLVPLIDKNTASRFTHIDNLNSTEIEMWLASPDDYKGMAFGLRIEGDSMTSSTGLSFPDGIIAVFDSNDIFPLNGDFVLAQVEGADDVTFKKFISDAGSYHLMPLNPSYPRIDKPFRVLAILKYAILPV